MRISQIKIGAILSYVSMGLSTVISLVYTPIMIQRLGDSEFGVYQTVLPIISYLNLLTFGLGSAYIRYYSRAKSADDKKGMAKLNGMFLITYLLLGGLVLVPIVSAFTQKTCPTGIEEKFSCYEKTVVTNQKVSLG